MGKNKHLNPEQIQRLLDYYVIFGTYNAVHEKLGIAVSTVKRHVVGNKLRVEVLKKEREPILDRLFTEIIETCSAKEMELIHTSKDLRAVSTVKGINYDKRALSRGEPTERLHVETEAELSKRIGKQLKGARPTKNRIKEYVKN